MSQLLCQRIESTISKLMKRRLCDFGTGIAEEFEVNVEILITPTHF
jgi:hypothetical protein